MERNRKNKWPAKLGLSPILAGAICLLGCSSVAPTSGGTGTNTSIAPATVAYTFSSPSLQINEYSTVPADNGSLVGTLTLPTPYVAQQFATDLNGQIYIAACTDANGSGEVFVYPPNSTGAAVPSNTIKIASCDVVDFVVDPAGQYLYVETQEAVDAPQTVSVYPVAASGAPVPIRTLQLPTAPWGVALAAADANGNIYAPGSTSSSNGVINLYGPEATGTDAPIRTITFENEVPTGLAIDASGDIFAIVAICCEGTDWVIEEFAPGAAGAARPLNTINLPPLPADTTADNGFVQLDAASNIFASLVLNPLHTPPSSSSVIYRFAPTATGHAAPTVTINDGVPRSLFALN